MTLFFFSLLNKWHCPHRIWILLLLLSFQFEGRLSRIWWHTLNPQKIRIWLKRSNLVNIAHNYFLHWLVLESFSSCWTFTTSHYKHCLGAANILPHMPLHISPRFHQTKSQSSIYKGIMACMVLICKRIKFRCIFVWFLTKNTLFVVLTNFKKIVDLRKSWVFS